MNTYEIERSGFKPYEISADKFTVENEIVRFYIGGNLSHYFTDIESVEQAESAIA